MPFTSREVLIPLVGPASTGALCRVAADGHLPPPHPAHLDRSISDLLESGLYQAGQQARAAVRRLKLGRGWLRSPAPVALSIVNPGDVAGLASDNSASAEVGLALAMLMYLTQSPNHTVIATGALEANSSEADGPIRPVHHLRAKFGVVEKYFRQAGISSPPAIFFTPEVDVDGVSVREKHAECVQALNAMGIDVVPARSLRAAAASLGALRLQQRPHEIWLRRAAITASILAAAGVAAFAVSTGKSWLSRRPVPMEFLASALDDGRIVQTPARFQETPGHVLEPLRACRTAAGIPLYEPGDVLFAKVQSGDPDEWATRSGLIYHALVVVSAAQTSAPVIVVRQLEAPWRSGVHPGEKVEFKGIVEQADELVVLLAQRFEDFDRNKLLTDLHGRLDSLRPAERVDAARNFLRKSAPGSLEYVFRTAGNGEGCFNE